MGTKIDIDHKKISEILSRGVDEVIEKNALTKKLASGKILRVKFGIDPTSPNIHIGRAVPLIKLKDFQSLGHKIVFIIGDFTGVIGDTSDKNSERPMLEEETVKRNLKSYMSQAGKIINIKKCEVYYNSEWLKKLDYHEIGRQADIFSLNEFISRENIKKRIDAGKRISLRELLYPLMQGYDSVAVKADLEIGGTDQRFNLLAGRELQRSYGQDPQNIMTLPLLEGLDGRKMSSSWGNIINILDSPNDIFGKIMSIPDRLIIHYVESLTKLSLSELKIIPPREAKAKLAKEIVSFLYSEKEAEVAEKEFNRVFKEKGVPSNIPSIVVKEKKLNILDLLVRLRLVSSKSEAKRLIVQGGVSIGGKIQSDWKKNIEIKNGSIVRVGKRGFVAISS